MYYGFYREKTQGLTVYRSLHLLEQGQVPQRSRTPSCIEKGQVPHDTKMYGEGLMREGTGSTISLDSMGEGTGSTISLDSMGEGTGSVEPMREGTCSLSLEFMREGTGS